VDRDKSSAALDCKDVEKMEANVYTRPRSQGEFGDSGFGAAGEPAAKTVQEWRNMIQVGEVGYSVFGTGLWRCGSV